MRGISPKKIIELVEKDLRAVEMHAKGVIFLNNRNELEEVVIKKFPKPELNVMAVIGVADESCETAFQSACPKVADELRNIASKQKPVVLGELIGFHRSRPYKETEGSKVLWRRPWFNLSPTQYKEISPALFRELQSTSDEAVRQWERGPYSDKHFKPGIVKFRARRDGNLIRRNGYGNVPSGVIFSASLIHRHLISDIYRAELGGGFLKHIARTINILLSPYLNGKNRGDFTKRIGAQSALEFLSELQSRKRFPLPDYYLLEILRRNMIRHREGFLEIMGALGVEPCQKLAQQKMAEIALPGSEARTNNIKIRVRKTVADSNASAFRRGRVGYLVFEVYPSVYRH